jgi:hypothetical protein
LPAVSYEHDFQLYRKAFEALEGGYQTRPPSVLVVSPEQLQRLAERGAIPAAQLERFIREGLLDASVSNGCERTAT